MTQHIYYKKEKEREREREREKKKKGVQLGSSIQFCS